MVSNTLFIRKIHVQDTTSETGHVEEKRPSADKFIPLVATPHPSISIVARSVFSIDYDLGSFKCVVHFSPDAWTSSNTTIDTRPITVTEVQSKSSIAKGSIQVHAIGKHIPHSKLLFIQPHKYDGVYKARNKTKDAHNHKILRHSLQKASHRSWAKLFFSRMSTTHRLLYNSKTQTCDQLRPSDSEKVPNEEDDISLRCMLSLLKTLRRTTQEAKDKVCIIRLSKVDAHEDHTRFKIEIREPGFETGIERNVPRQIVSDEDYQQFWVVNGKAVGEDST